MFDVFKQRADFPIFNQTFSGKPLVYLDNAASTQKPAPVIDALKDFYLNHYSNVHRGIYTLSEQATDQFEQARQKIQNFIHAARANEIVFTHGTTESINLVAHSYLRPRLQSGDQIVLSQAEHHANIVPWKRLCEETGSQLVILPLTPKGEIDLSCLPTLLNDKTRLVAITHLSNVLGTLTDLTSLIQQAHQYNVPVLVDGAQAIAHIPIDVQALDCDFYTFSGHKLYGPTGIGVLYAKYEHLFNMVPWQSGGGMIERVQFNHIDYREPPHRFEAGTPAIAEAIGLGATIDYLNQLDWQAIVTYESKLFKYLENHLRDFSQIKSISHAPNRQSIVSFTIDSIHAHDIATILNSEGIAVRAGHHCAMPLMDYLNIPATTRISLGFYNTFEDIDRLVSGLRKVFQLLG